MAGRKTRRKGERDDNVSGEEEGAQEGGQDI